MDVIARDYLGLAREEMRVAQYEQTVSVKESTEYAQEQGPSKRWVLGRTCVQSPASGAGN